MKKNKKNKIFSKIFLKYKNKQDINAKYIISQQFFIQNPRGLIDRGVQVVKRHRQHKYTTLAGDQATHLPRAVSFPIRNFHENTDCLKSPTKNVKYLKIP